MKKFLLSMLTLLMSISGAWAADNLPASTWNILSALPTDNWVAMGENTPAGVTALGNNYTAYYRTQEVTLETAGMIDINFKYSSGSHRLEILGVDALNESNEVVASDYHFGYTGTYLNLNNYLLNGLSAGTYTLRYIINSGVSNSVGNITINKFEDDVVASLPELTTDVNNPKYYSIASYNRGGYLTSNGAGQAMTHVDFAAGSSWYFTAIDGNKYGTVIGGVIAHCSDGTQMQQNWQTAASGQTIYILPNGFNNNGFCLSKTLPISSNSCCDANNYNTGLGNWYPHRDGTKDDWQGTTWVFNPTVPIDQTGYYYFKGMATDRHPYLYSDFVTKGNVATYHHDLPSTPSNGHIWKVTNSGTTFTLSNGEGLPLTTTPGSTSSENNPHETLTLSAASAGPVYYFTEAINLTSWGDDTRLTTWDGHSDAADNKWTFELADVSAGVYDVVVQGNDDGYVTYSGQNAKNGGFFVAASIAEGDITVHEIKDYTSSTSIAGSTITVVYTHTIDYTLTDANGKKYTGSYSGIVGEEPVFTGCVGYSLSDITWDGYSFTATINFPFAVSAPTFLGQFHNKSGYNSIDFLWHAESTGVVVHSGDMPNETTEEQNKYLWTIEPAISGLNITFGIKNVATDTYITSTETGNSHNPGAVTLTDTATPLEYQTSSTTNCGPIYVWYIPSTRKYLSVNSISGGAGSLLGVWSLAANHDGPSTGFHTYLDLISRFWEKNAVSSKLANAGQYGYPAVSETNTAYLFWAKGAMARGLFDGTKENYNNLRTWYEGFLAADVVLPIDGTFLRIRSILGDNAYLKAANAGSRMTVTTTDNDAETIFLFKDSKLVSYSKGIAINNVREIGTIGGASSTVTFVKAVNGKLGQLSVTATFANNTNYLYSTGVNGSDADRNTYSASFVNQNSFTIEEVTELPVSISAAGYATYCFPVNVTFNGNGNANSYVATSASNNSIHFDEVEAFSAGQGILLKGTEGNYTFNVGGEGNNNDDLLSGTTAAVTVASLGVAEGSTLCAFQKSGSDYGFFKYPTAQTTFPGFKAYYIYTPSSGNTGSNFFTLSFDDDDVTAIASAINGQILNGQYYDLQGRKVVAPQKGQLYIHNGKKVLY